MFFFVVKNIRNTKNLFKKKMHKKIFKIFFLTGILNKNIYKIREFSENFLQDSSRHLITNLNISYINLYLFLFITYSIAHLNRVQNIQRIFLRFNF